MAYAYHNLWADIFPTLNINFTVNFPLQNDLANGLKGRSRRGRISGTSDDRRRRRSASRSKLVTHLQTYESALSRLNAARQGREAAEQVYASEQRKFKNGASTTYLVLQRQDELNQARLRELSAQTSLNKSIVELDRVEGTILTNNGVNLKTLGTQALATAGPSPKP